MDFDFFQGAFIERLNNERLRVQVVGIRQGFQRRHRPVIINLSYPACSGSLRRFSPWHTSDITSIAFSIRSMASSSTSSASSMDALVSDFNPKVDFFVLSDGRFWGRCRSLPKCSRPCRCSLVWPTKSVRVVHRDNEEEEEEEEDVADDDDDDERFVESPRRENIYPTTQTTRAPTTRRKSASTPSDKS